ncbi:phenylalanine--tRNA ligase subunit beta [Mycobacterium sp. CBMA271]|uniref:phenylalanine--tRNA ligase subunit beta n=1 Tax=unclassified Mycobacteroides TaxID=2618759 RepID=UPI0012DF0EAD|nr:MULTISPECIES: phenylalanine--tRNA ligase subunit beta [unclassified Mycobacteroides]MUM17749.1 phenylalanine--tRNA ligase subunit beta [Mycobacteroides sp. CBMA 326]MUM22976.1 phenylalanine--tRNA ligase subunit beta [Mycobacteroides sp. CBMA 271]
MRIPYSWLIEVLRVGAPDFSATPTDIEEALIRLGHEVEEVVVPGPVTGPLVVGRVAEITELTEFKKPIRFCLVDVGEDEPREIVCGASNFAIDDLVVVALPGATLPGDFAIATRKTYGHTSDGMICSTAELGLGPESSGSSGILVLPAGTAEPGADAAEVVGLDDAVFDLSITPDRGYCLSVRGLARDLACAYDLEFVDPAVVPPLPADGPSLPVRVDAGTGVKRFGLRPVIGIDPAAVSPWWLQRRLMLCGIRTISPAVDATNYVMLEIGHPMHAHDKSRITGDFRVRFATPGETVVTLDDVERTLEPGDVLIVDDAAVTAIGGVMGAGSTEMRADSTDVLLEAAIWDTAAVLRTQRRLHLHSEAGRRYERSVDPAISIAALDRCAALLRDIAGGSTPPELTDWTSDAIEATKRRVISIPADLPARVAGIDYADGVAEHRLRQIGAVVSRDKTAEGDTLHVTPPSWRPDIVEGADLVEEVLRLEGLEDIPSILPAAPQGGGLNPAQRRRRAVGKSLALGGYTEILPMPFLPAGVFDAWGLADADPRRRTTAVLNPLESDRPELASTLLPGLLEALSRNISRGAPDLALFTIGQVVRPTAATRAIPLLDMSDRPSETELAALFESLPAQPVHVALVLAGAREPSGPWGRGRPVDVTDVLEAARIIGRAAYVDVSLRAAEELPWHPGRCAEIVVDGHIVGHAGELHPAVIERLDLPKRTCALELSLDALPFANPLPAPRISPFPAVLQDVSLVVTETVPADAVTGALRDGAGELLEDVRLVEVYTGPQAGEGNKSLNFRLRFRAADRTLTEDEATAARVAAVASAAGRVGATQRA